MSTHLQQAIEYIANMPILIKIIALIFCVAIEYVFPIFPGDTIVLIAGFLNAQGALDLLEISLAVLIGSLIGALLGYFIGRYITLNPNKCAWVKKLTSEPGFLRFNSWYQKWGSIFLILNRFMPGVRALFFIAAGSARISLFKVIALGVSSALLFNAVLIAAGYWLGNNTELLLSYFYRFNLIAYIILGAVVVLLLLLWWQKKRS